VSVRIERREFIKAVAAATAELATLIALPDSGPLVAPRMTVVLSADRDTVRTAARAQGVMMGVEEAARSAVMFGGGVELERLTTGADVAAAARRAIARGAVVVVGGEAADECTQLAAACAHADALYVNVLCSADELRGAACDRHMFHVAPSDAMIASARGQLPATNAQAESRVSAWDSSLQAFGADTLNQRFRARFGVPMTGDSWAGWFAVKCLSEAVLRTGARGTPALIQYLESERSGSDGHKGRLLTFRAWDHQLRQPLYVMESGSAQRAIEVPTIARDAGSSRSSREILDMLGKNSSSTSCRFMRE